MTNDLLMTEEEAISIINDLRVKTSKSGQAVLIDDTLPVHLSPLRSIDSYMSEIAWRQDLLALHELEVVRK